MAGLGMIFKTLGKSTDEAVEIAARAGQKAGAKVGKASYKQSIKSASRAAKQEAMEEGFKRGLKEASVPKAAGTNTDIYFKNADGVEYRRITNPNYSSGNPRKSKGGQYNQYIYQQREAGGTYTNISGKKFGTARQAYGGTGYASYDDMLMGNRINASQVQEAADVAQEAAESGAGFWSGIGEWAHDNQLLTAGMIAGGAVLGAELLDES